jgi:hypothetical protein
MEYHCRTIAIDKLPLGPQGFLSPLCDRCKSKDCSNPIETARISIRGVVETHKVYVRGREPYFVVDCEGFVL